MQMSDVLLVSVCMEPNDPDGCSVAIATKLHVCVTLGVKPSRDCWHFLTRRLRVLLQDGRNESAT